jgi:hypothetical protein
MLPKLSAIRKGMYGVDFEKPQGESRKRVKRKTRQVRKNLPGLNIFGHEKQVYMRIIW